MVAAAVMAAAVMAAAPAPALGFVSSPCWSLRAEASPKRAIKVKDLMLKFCFCDCFLFYYKFGKDFRLNRWAGHAKKYLI